MVKRAPRFRPTLEALEGRWAPAILTVNSLADNTTADSALTLREAVNVVDGTLGRALTTGEKAQVTGTLGSNDTIQFQLPVGPQTITLTGGALSITKAVALTGPGAGLLTINGNNAGRVLILGHDYSQNLSLNVSLSGLTISGGSAVSGSANYGGGLLNFGTLSVRNCTFTGNAAGSSGGGGIYNDGAMTVANCTFSGNSVSNGGTGAGILVSSSATLNVTDSTFTGNTAPNGGEGAGIANSGTLNVAGCTFNNNTVGSNGAGIHNSSTGKLTVTNSTFTNGVCTSDGGGLDSDGTATVTDCTFANNSVGSEGGAIDSHGTLTLSNSTLVGNTAVSRGGALNISGASQITNCTITGNRVSSTSGIGGGIDDTKPAKVYNDIVFGNFRGPSPGTTASDIVGTVDSSSAYNLIGTGGAGGLVNGANGNQVGVTSAGLGALANNGGPTQTMALLPGSPAIDRGGNAYVAAGVTDQRGLTRIVNGTVDIGAFEVQAPTGPTASTLLVAGFPSSIQAGTASTIIVTAKDSSGNTVAGYTGTVHFTSSDPQAVLPADYTFVSADNGSHTFTVTLTTAGTQSITAQDTVTASITGTQSGVIVTPAAASTLSVAGFPNPTTAGFAGSFNVTVRDAFGNTATGYLGTIHFTSTDNQAVLPADYTFVAADNGVHSFSATFKTAGSQALTASDSSTGITGTHAAITVNPASASVLSVTGLPSSIQAGAAGTFTVTARDAFGNSATGYRGTIHFTSSDPQAVLPADYTFVAGDNGAHTFSATFKTVGTQTVTATDKAVSSLTGTSAASTVNPAAFGTLSVTGFATPATAGVDGTFTVTARDTLGNIVTGYQGTVHFTSTDPQAVLPADYLFVAADNGVHTFSATLKTAGSQSISATDAAASVTGTESSILVNPAAASVLVVAGFPSPTQVNVAGSFTVTARDAFGNTATAYQGTITFTSSDSQAVLPANYTFVAADNGAHTFSATFKTAGTQSLTATDLATASITGTQASITVNPAPAGPVLLVNSTADNTTADNFLTLREAIEVVNGTLGRALTPAEQAQITGTLGPNDAIQFNLPAGPQTITLTAGALSITQPVAINGPGASNLTINGNNADRVFIVGYNYSQNLSLNVSINGLTITGGSATVSGKNYGGGLLNFGTLTLNNDTFTGNSAGSSGGGAIYNDGAITVSNSTFSSNSVSNGGPGGAIQNAGPATLTVNNCAFTSNTATGGASGAALANSGQLTVTGSSITGNSADSNAGGIYNSSEGTLKVSTTTVANNTSGSDGGGIDNDGTATISTSTLSNNSASSEGGGLGNKGSLTLTNCTLYGNTAVSDGGGMQTSGANVTITNCTITANRVTAGSGGVFGGGIYAATPAKIYNTIVAGNFRGADPSTTADDIAGTVDASSAYNLIGIGGSSGLTNGVNNNQVGVTNLGLGTLANNGGPTMTVALLAGSPALDDGGNAFVVAGETDQRGLPRIVNGIVDIGAFESQ
jgi:predicted outer membrane repeat protein